MCFNLSKNDRNIASSFAKRTTNEFIFLSFNGNLINFVFYRLLRRSEYFHPDYSQYDLCFDAYKTCRPKRFAEKVRD